MATTAAPQPMPRRGVVVLFEGLALAVWGFALGFLCLELVGLPFLMITIAAIRRDPPRLIGFGIGFTAAIAWFSIPWVTSISTSPLDGTLWFAGWFVVGLAVVVAGTLVHRRRSRSS